MGYGKSPHTNGVKKTIYLHAKQNENGPLSYTMQKNKHKMD